MHVSTYFYYFYNMLISASVRHLKVGPLATSGEPTHLPCVNAPAGTPSTKVAASILAKIVQNINQFMYITTHYIGFCNAVRYSLRALAVCVQNILSRHHLR